MCRPILSVFPNRPGFILEGYSEGKRFKNVHALNLNCVPFCKNITVAEFDRDLYLGRRFIKLELGIKTFCGASSVPLSLDFLLLFHLVDITDKFKTTV